MPLRDNYLKILTLPDLGEIGNRFASGLDAIYLDDDQPAVAKALEAIVARFGYRLPRCRLSCVRICNRHARPPGVAAKAFDDDAPINKWHAAALAIRFTRWRLAEFAANIIRLSR